MESSRNKQFMSYFFYYCYFVDVGILLSFMSVYHTCEGPCSQKRASDPSGLESEEDYEP